MDVELQPPRSPTLSPSPLMITDGRTDPIDVTTAKSHLRFVKFANISAFFPHTVIYKIESQFNALSRCILFFPTAEVTSGLP